MDTLINVHREDHDRRIQRKPAQIPPLRNREKIIVCCLKPLEFGANLSTARNDWICLVSGMPQRGRRGQPWVTHTEGKQAVVSPEESQGAVTQVQDGGPRRQKHLTPTLIRWNAEEAAGKHTQSWTGQCDSRTGGC